MSFFSLEFIVLFVALIVILCFVRNMSVRNTLLLIGSYVFYGWAEPIFLILLAGLSLLVWFLGLRIEKAKNVGVKKIYLVLGVVACLIVLVVFKYLQFFVNSFSYIFKYETGLINIAIPLGISFFILQAISYIADVYMQKVKAEKSCLPVLLYVGFFPQIVSGPIVKAHDFLPQMKERVQLTKGRFSHGIQLIVLGIFKKKVIADRLSFGVDAVFADPGVYSGLSLLTTTVGYAIQIYCDFSGYSDIAVGVAYILGFDLGKNFEVPYIAKNPSDFWRRWHISLSTWFRDYVYIPLGGNRKGIVRTCLNLMITMLLSGLWHGASWTFVFWGAFHGLVSTVHMLFKRINKDKKIQHKVITVLGTACNVLIVWLLWIPFRAPDLSTAWRFINRIFTMAPGVVFLNFWAGIYFLLIVGIQVASAIRNKGVNLVRPLNLEKFWNKVWFVVLILLILCFAYIGDSAFIYAQF